MKKIFIIDDSKPTVNLLKKNLKNDHYDVEAFYDAESAIEKMKKDSPDLIIMDFEMPKMDGAEAFKIIKSIYPDMKVVIMTAYADIEKTHYFLDEGVVDFIAKPFSLNKIKNVLGQVFQKKTIKDLTYEEFLDKRLNYIGESKATKDCIDKALKVSNSDLPILILGENGTGKEMLADFIHYNSIRKYNNMIKVNCAAIPRELAENEFFGHEKGAFTGAINTRPGKVELSDTGTLFLDEIGDLDLNIQTKLLRILEYKKFERLGGKETIHSDFRLICATNKDLEEEVKKGRFREDLYYRINAIKLYIPPLRERIEDIEVLVKHFIKKYREKYMTIANKISRDALLILKEYEWSGNIRELKNVVETMVSLTPNEQIQVENIPRFIYNTKDENEDLFIGNSIVTLEELEKKYIIYCLKKTGINKKETARLLGISEKTLYNKIHKYKIRL